jgi:hypothetical protein
MNYSFKPNVKKSDLDNTKQGNATDFLQRVEYFKQKQEKKLEEIRKSIVDPSSIEYTFKPQLSDLAQNMKRNLNDLFVKNIF